MIRAGKWYRRKLPPCTTVIVVRRRHGQVTYRLKGTELTISVGAFREIYQRWRPRAHR